MEQHGVYNVPGQPGRLPDDVLAPAELWREPGGQEKRKTLTKANLTIATFADLVGVSGRTVRRWMGDDNDIPYAAWAVLCEEAGYGRIWKRDFTVRRGVYNVPGLPDRLPKDVLTPAAVWRSPTGLEVRAALHHANRTGNEFATMVGAGIRSVTRWAGGDGHSTTASEQERKAAGIPYAAWAILCEEAGYGKIWKTD